MDLTSDILLRSYGGNTVQDMLVAAGIFLGIFLAAWAFKHFIVGQIARLTQKTPTKIDDQFATFVSEIGGATYGVIALYVSSQYLVLPSLVENVIRGIALIVIVYETVRVLHKFIMFFVLKKLVKEADPEGRQIVSLLRPIIAIALWSTAILMILSNMGINITSLIASLGVGGLAVALAVQNILGDIFNSFAIYLDKPFAVGDFIIVGDHMGTVKAVGLKSTRLQALGGEELVIPNKELTAARIQNFKKMERRRIVFGFGVEYGTPVKQLKKIPKMLKDIMKDIKDADIDRVHFKKFGDSSLDFEVVYFVASGEFNKYMDIQQRVNLAIVEAFEKEDISVALPTRTVHIVKEGEGALETVKKG